MATVTIELPPQDQQTELNLRRWAELLEDPELAKVEGRIETDRHGHITKRIGAGSRLVEWKFVSIRVLSESAKQAWWFLLTEMC